jgi:hypothetical protein
VASAALAAHQADWTHPRLRRILTTALDREGVSFTFDLPAVLQAECKRRGIACPLDAYLQEALEQDDRWGTRVRALSAQAAARYRQGDVIAAQALMRDANHANQGYAGFATFNLLSLANRWWDLGQPDPNEWPWNNHVDWAADTARRIRADAFRDERSRLVDAYRSWQAGPDFSDTSAAIGRPDTMADRDQRLAYVEHLSARWACPTAQPNMEGLQRLVPLSLSDSTLLDAVLARLVGAHLPSLSDAALGEACAQCAEYLAGGRPWEVGGA